MAEINTSVQAGLQLAGGGLAVWTWPRAIPVPRSRLNALYYYMIAAYRAGFRSLGFSNVTVCVQVLEDPGATVPAFMAGRAPRPPEMFAS